MSRDEKWKRAIDFDANKEPEFASYLVRNNINIADRSYLLHMGSNMISPVNNDFVRVSIPYKRAKSNYGVIVLPKENVCKSACKSMFGGDLFDIDLGNKSSTHKVSYIDEKGNHAQRVESVRYIERYMNVTQQLYSAGQSDGFEDQLGSTINMALHNGQFDNLLKSDAVLGSTQDSYNFIYGKPCRAVGDVLSSRLLAFHQFLYNNDCLPNGEFNMSHLRTVLDGKCKSLKEVLLSDDTNNCGLQSSVLNNVYGTGLGAVTKTNKAMMLNSYVDGYLDAVKFDACKLAANMYQTRKDKVVELLREHCTNEYNSYVDNKDMYKAYEQYVGVSLPRDLYDMSDTTQSHTDTENTIQDIVVEEDRAFA